MWLRDREFRQIVIEAWRGASERDQRWPEMLQFCGEWLARWNKECFGNVQRKIKLLKNEIKQLNEGPRTEDTTKKEVVLSNVLDEWLAREELLWKQRGRSDWLKAGEKQYCFLQSKSFAKEREEEI